MSLPYGIPKPTINLDFTDMNSNVGTINELQRINNTGLGTVDFSALRASKKYTQNRLGLISEAPLNVPALSFDGGVAKGFLAESGATNLALYSEAFSNAWWAPTNLTVTPNATTAPDGTLTADRLTENSATGVHSIRSSELNIFGSVRRTASIFVKKGGRRYVQFTHGQGGFGSFCSVIYDLDTNTVTDTHTISAGPTMIFRGATIVPSGNNSVRLTLTIETTANGTQFGLAHANVSTFGAGTLVGGFLSFTGDGVSATDIWGAQLEAGTVDFSFASSYIPTTTGTANRSADNFRITGASGAIGQTEGTILMQSDLRNNPARLGGARFIELTDGTDNNRIIINTSTTLIVSFFVGAINGAEQALITSGLIPEGVVKIGATYSSNYFALFVNGVKIGEDLSGVVPATSQIAIGCTRLGTTQLQDSIGYTRLFKQRLSNELLQLLTRP